MCNITCIYNEICHITNEIFQAQITRHIFNSQLTDTILCLYQDLFRTQGAFLTLKNISILGPTNRYSNKKKGMWPSCVERYTPKPVSQ
jgi:hypothetical protein